MSLLLFEHQNGGSNLIAHISNINLSLFSSSTLGSTFSRANERRQQANSRKVVGQLAAQPSADQHKIG